MLPSPPGAPPAYWQREVVFFANLLSLFFGNEAQTRTLADEVGEVDSYGGRLLPVIDLLFRGPGGQAPNNLLVLDRPADESLSDYFRGALGLSLPRVEILSHDAYLALADASLPDDPFLQRAAASPAEWIDGYVTDSTLEALGRRIGKRPVSSPEGSRRGNNKLLLHRFLQETGFPTVAAVELADPGDVAAAARRLLAQGFQAGVLKAQVGASGIGMQKITSLAEVVSSPPPIPDAYFFEGACYLQGWVTPGEEGVTEVRSPSVQMFLGDREDECVLFDITEQILGGHSVHHGNISPAPYLGERPEIREELLRQAQAGARWLHQQGYRGTASADFLLVSRGEAACPTAYLCEINARVTGATYPSVLARHLLGGSGAWLLRNLRLDTPSTGSELLRDLSSTRHLFRRDEPSGIFPVNFNFGSDGSVRKGQFLCLAPTPDECHALLELAASKLPTKWRPDRD